MCKFLCQVLVGIFKNQRMIHVRHSLEVNESGMQNCMCIKVHVSLSSDLQSIMHKIRGHFGWPGQLNLMCLQPQDVVGGQASCFRMF